MSERPRILNISPNGRPRFLTAQGFCDRVQEIGDLVLLAGGKTMPPDDVARHIREADVYLAGWDSTPIPASVAANPGRLRYVCGVTGTMRGYVPVELVEAGIPLTNWGDAPANVVAEAAMALLLACLKDMHARVIKVRAGEWAIDSSKYGGGLDGLRVGVYGCGVIGRRFLEMIRPFDPIVTVFDPFATEVPDWCTRVQSLDDLFTDIQALVIHAGWTPETNKSVNAERLARLPDHGVVINTARGGIVDQEALFKELEAGRLRAALDVLEPDHLPANHPARQWPNLILTGHQASQQWPGSDKYMGRMHHYALDNLRRFVAGQPLRFVMDVERYRLST
jgi:phosphoglycerate dehydrogenase-like enzyme